MNPIWLVLLVAVAFLVILRLKGRRKKRLKMPVYSRRIDGFQVVAILAPEMAGGCLFDHGVQFGRGFRRKHGPALPHARGCQCATVPFSYTSNEVFNGALRNPTDIRNEIEGLAQAEANQLVETLKRIESGPLPEALEAYQALVQAAEFPEQARRVVREFCDKRFAFLRSEAARSPRNNEGEPADPATKN